MTNPHAGSFTDGNGVLVKEGDKVLYQFGKRRAILNEALQDGDAFITFEDGTRAEVKWRHLCKIPE